VKKLATLTALLVLALGAAACGDDDEADEGAATTTEESTEGTAEAAAGDIVAVAQETPELSTLVEAVTAADLVETLQGEGPYTVFAPTNDAFAAVEDLDQLLKPANQDQLAEVLTYHVVPDEVLAADLTDGQQVETVQGEQLEITIDGETVGVNGATVVQADVPASNGVVHVIDEVLLPPS
jgi:uncharacterized surface protein with fasciclin (FAS1) repeats